MKRFQYAACFFAGVFLVNAVPHFIHGLEGESFPTPFANPPGTGLSSPLVNILWALANLLLGYFLLRKGRVSIHDNRAMGFIFLGIVACSTLLSLMAPFVLQHYHQTP